eukprot:2335920-Prymnesium_polylepis.2
MAAAVRDRRDRPVGDGDAHEHNVVEHRAALHDGQDSGVGQLRHRAERDVLQLRAALGDGAHGSIRDALRQNGGGGSDRRAAGGVLGMRAVGSRGGDTRRLRCCWRRLLVAAGG